MPLLPYAVAINADAPADLLRVAAAHTALRDHGTRAALRVHPMLPADLVPTTDPGNGDALDPVAVDTALRLGHTTSATRGRLLASLDLWDLTEAADDNTALHADVLAHLAANLGDADVPVAFIISVLDHPALTPATELVALRTMLTSRPGSGSPDVRFHPGHLRYALTRATAHPAHLSELAAIARPHLGLTGDLRRYAELAAAGHDPHAARLADVRAHIGTARPGRLTWADAVVATSDPTIAADALASGRRGQRPDLAILGAITSAGRLRYTDAGYRAHAIRAHVARASVDPLPHPPTDADLLLATSPSRDRDVLDRIFMFPLVPAGVLALAAETACRELATGSTAGLKYATLLALRPGVSPEQRAALATAIGEELAARKPDDLAERATVVHAIAAAPDPTAAALTLPVAALTRTAAYSHDLAAHLARVLMPILAAHAPDAATTNAALALEGGFTGTLADLLATARTIVS